jgi:hypothetical protein
VPAAGRVEHALRVAKLGALPGVKEIGVAIERRRN